MKTDILPSGCWDLAGGEIRISRMFPVLDGGKILPSGCRTDGESSVFTFTGREIEIVFHKSADRVSISLRIDHSEGLHDISLTGEVLPASGKTIRAFTQGFGMEGPSGMVTVGSDRAVSHGLTALCGEHSSLFSYVKDHTTFSTRFTIQKSTTIFDEPVIFFQAGFNLENAASGPLTLPALFFFEKEEKDPQNGLRECAEDIAAFMNARHAMPPAFHWCSWYYHYQNFSQKHLEEYLEGFGKMQRPFNYIQIDAGYCTSPGDWLKQSACFPEGLRKAARTITDAGFLPGIWIAPFIVGDHSELYRDHPDWILYDAGGAPVTPIQSFNEPKCWGLDDCCYYVLDTSHPEAMEYLRTVFRTLYSWGFRLFKTDFMLWSMQDSSRVKRHDPSLTSVQIMRRTLSMIRSEIGEESYLLGCIAPFLPFVGYADGMRIAGDVGAQWEGAYGPVNLLREITADNYFNNIYWQNDPDSVLLRDFHIHLRPEEIRSLALLQALSGGIITTSDPVHQLSEERKSLLRLIEPGDGAAPVLPLFAEDAEEIVMVHHLEQGSLLFVLNPTDHALSFSCRFSGLAGREACWIREDSHMLARPPYCSPAPQEYYITKLNPHECVLLYLTDAPLEKEPVNLWNWN